MHLTPAPTTATLLPEPDMKRKTTLLSFCIERSAFTFLIYPEICLTASINLLNLSCQIPTNPIALIMSSLLSAQSKVWIPRHCFQNVQQVISNDLFPYCVKSSWIIINCNIRLLSCCTQSDCCLATSKPGEYLRLGYCLFLQLLS